MVKNWSVISKDAIYGFGVTRKKPYKNLLFFLIEKVRGSSRRDPCRQDLPDRAIENFLFLSQSEVKL